MKLQEKIDRNPPSFRFFRDESERRPFLFPQNCPLKNEFFQKFIRLADHSYPLTYRWHMNNAIRKFLDSKREVNPSVKIKNPAKVLLWVPWSLKYDIEKYCLQKEVKKIQLFNAAFEYYLELYKDYVSGKKIWRNPFL